MPEKLPLESSQQCKKNPGKVVLKILFRDDAVMLPNIYP